MLLQELDLFQASEVMILFWLLTFVVSFIINRQILSRVLANSSDNDGNLSVYITISFLLSLFIVVLLHMLFIILITFLFSAISPLYIDKLILPAGYITILIACTVYVWRPIVNDYRKEER